MNVKNVIIKTVLGFFLHLFIFNKYYKSNLITDITDTRSLQNNVPYTKSHIMYTYFNNIPQNVSHL